MNAEDRTGYGDEVVALAKKLADALPSAGVDVDEQAVWEAYAGTEKLIAVLRFRLEYETPGVFTKLPDAKDPMGLLDEALALLSRSRDEIQGQRLVGAVETLRAARNDLRSYLTAKRKAATKAERPPRGRVPKS